MIENLISSNSSENCSSELCLSHNKDLPLSAKALGYVAFDGTSQNPQQRITQYENFIIIDSTHCYTKVKTKLYPEKIWVRVPSFFPLLEKSVLGDLELVFQVNDYRATLGAFSAMNVLYDLSTEESLPTSLLPYDTCMELTPKDEEHLINGEQSILEPDYTRAHILLTTLLEKYPHLKVENLYPYIVALRLIKSDEEIKNLEEAINATNTGINDLLLNL